MKILASLCVAFCFVATPTYLSADDTANTKTTAESTKPTGLFAGMLGSVTEATIQMSDQSLDYLAKRETAKKLATFQKNYYDSLIELGFDEDQAFTLLRDLGNPMLDHTRRRTD